MAALSTQLTAQLEMYRIFVDNACYSFQMSLEHGAPMLLGR